MIAPCLMKGWSYIFQAGTSPGDGECPGRWTQELPQRHLQGSIVTLELSHHSGTFNPLTGLAGKWLPHAQFHVKVRNTNVIVFEE